MQNRINFDEKNAMRTTVTIDDSLFERAVAMLDPGVDRSEVFREAMATYVRVQAARRLAALGGSMPDMPEPVRRRPAKAQDTPA